MRPLLALLFSVLSLTAADPASFALPAPAAEASLPGEGALRRYDGYVKRWNTIRPQWATEVAKDQGAVVFFGDSITQGWGTDFRKAFEGMKLANRGIGGDTTRGMLLRLKEDVLALNPKAVVLLMGTNDIEVEVPVAVEVRHQGRRGRAGLGGITAPDLAAIGAQQAGAAEVAPVEVAAEALGHGCQRGRRLGVVPDQPAAASNCCV